MKKSRTVIDKTSKAECLGKFFKIIGKATIEATTKSVQL